MSKAAGVRSGLFRDARALVFGLAVFTFSWVCWRGPVWDDYNLMFVAGTLLAASFLTLFKSVRGNVVAAVFGGYLLMEIAYEFWIMPVRAEVPFLSLRHVTYFVSEFSRAGGDALLFLTLSVLILACAARTLRRLASR